MTMPEMTTAAPHREDTHALYKRIGELERALVAVNEIRKTRRTTEW